MYQTDRVGGSHKLAPRKGEYLRSLAVAGDGCGPSGEDFAEALNVQKAPRSLE